MAKDDKSGRVTISLNKSFVREHVNRASGETFYSVTIPSGTVIDGEDMGGYRFTCNYAAESKFNENEMYMGFPSGWELNLERTVKDEDATEREGSFVPVLDEDGQPVREQRRASVEQLAGAIAEERRAFSESRSAERAARVYVTVPARLVDEMSNSKTGETFYSVTIPSGTVVDGEDLGGYRFTCNYANPSKRDPEQRYVTFPPDFEVALSRTVRDAEASEAEGRFVAATGPDGRPVRERVIVAASRLSEALEGPKPEARDGQARIPQQSIAAPEQTASRAR